MKVHASSQRTLQVKPLTRSHVDEVASLHRRCFEGYFLSVMGDAFLRVFYEEFVANPERNPAFVVLRDGRVVGFVSGTVESKEFYRRLFRARFGGLARAALAQAARSREARRALLSRTGAIWRAVAARFGGKRRSRRQPPPGAVGRRLLAVEVRARLLAIGVAPEARGSGVAETLVAALCRRLAELGQEYVGLSVNAENARAIAFYEKNGWRRDPSEGGSIAFMRSTAA